VVQPALLPARLALSLAEWLGVKRQAIGAMRKRGTLTARIARDLPELAVPHSNGFNHD
jgi:hypothetical protein